MGTLKLIAKQFQIKDTMPDKINQKNKQGDSHGYWESIYADNVYTKGHYIHGRIYGYWITQNNSYITKLYVAK